MSAPRRTGSELDALRSAPVLVATPSEVEAERAEVVPWLEEQIAELPLRRATARAQTRRRAMGLSAALAVAAGAGFVIWTMAGGAWPEGAGSHPEVRASVETPAATLLDGRLESGALEVLPGSKLGRESRFRTSAEGGARLLTSAGATLSAFPGTEFALAPSGAAGAGDAVVELSRGSIGFSVPKLEAGHAFRVRTADALVTVVGTRFFVDARATTCVRVEEGAVHVKRGQEERLLRPGDAWGCDAPSGGDDASQKTAQAAPERASARAARGEGQLDQQNRLLATALAAERKGDLGRARAAFDELLRRYPDSPFGPEARAGLTRLKGR